MKYIIGILIALVLLLTALILYRQSEEPVDLGTRLHFDKYYTQMKKIKTEKVTYSSKEYEVIKAVDVLTVFNIKREGLKDITFFANDGGSLKVTSEELDKIYLQALDNGTYRLVIPSDQFKQRWLKNITGIECT